MLFSAACFSCNSRYITRLIPHQIETEERINQSLITRPTCCQQLIAYYFVAAASIKTNIVQRQTWLHNYKIPKRIRVTWHESIILLSCFYDICNCKHWKICHLTWEYFIAIFYLINYWIEISFVSRIFYTIH